MTRPTNRRSIASFTSVSRGPSVLQPPPIFPERIITSIICAAAAIFRAFLFFFHASAKRVVPATPKARSTFSFPFFFLLVVPHLILNRWNSFYFSSSFFQLGDGGRFYCPLRRESRRKSLFDGGGFSSHSSRRLLRLWLPFWNTSKTHVPS